MKRWERAKIIDHKEQGKTGENGGMYFFPPYFSNFKKYTPLMFCTSDICAVRIFFGGTILSL